MESSTVHVTIGITPGTIEWENSTGSSYMTEIPILSSREAGVITSWEEPWDTVKHSAKKGGGP